MKAKLWMSRDGDRIGGIRFSRCEPILDDDHVFDPKEDDATTFLCEDIFRQMFRVFGLRKGRKKQVIVTIEDV